MAWKWYESELVKTEDINASVRRFWLKTEEEIEFEPGQFVTMDLPISDKRLKRWRSYSIASPNNQDLLEFCVVNLEGGPGTDYLFDELKIGDNVRFKGPSGTFVAPVNPEFDLVLLCTGTGVAPFRPMLYDLLKRQKTTRNIHLIFGTRIKNGLLYRDEFERLAKEHPNFKYTPVLSRDESWDGVKGHLHQVYLEDYKNTREDVKFYICGWSKMIDEAVANLFVKLKYDRSQIIYELYG